MDSRHPGSLEILRGIQSEPKEIPLKRPKLTPMLDKISTIMSRIARLIGQVSLQFSDDENVIFFLLRHHNQLDALMGQGYANKLLKKMHPKGTQEVGRFLMKRYSARGFVNILPAITAKITRTSPASS